MLTVIYLVARKVLSFKEAMECIPKGFIAMVPPIIILTLAVIAEDHDQLPRRGRVSSTT